MEFVEVASADQLGNEEKCAVEVGGKRVVLARVEGKLYALGAICTHERANLDEGTLMGHELYCPLHFSCFDVRTGEAMGPPADKSTKVYAVKVEDGKVLVSSDPVDPDELEEVEVGDAAPPVQAATATAADGDRQERTPVATAAAPADTAQDNGAPVDRAADEQPSVEQPAEKQSAADAAAPPPREVADGTGETGKPPPPTPQFAPAGPVTVFARVITRIEELEWLDNAAQQLGAGLRPIREGERTGKVFELLHGRLTGHALHPAMSDLPLGLWVGQVALDAVGEHGAAGKLGALGIASGVGAAVTGTADWTVSDGGDRRVGLLHGIGQLAAMTIQGGSLVARVKGRQGPAKVLAGVGLGVSVAFAYLGGHLVLGRGVMVDHTAWNVEPRRWTQAIVVTDLSSGDFKAVDVEGRSVLVSRSEDTVSAIDNICSHAGGPLNTGKVEDGVVTCPWHGSQFCLKDGSVRRGPAQHPQPLLETREHAGWIEVRARR
ncbi:MAG: Rieske 2Fe-2S domain-containing protein [Solirubrobacterales bacterium]|nr:Rieske 2Fe-2S domain-containing protein [Solirubrobacterales bacterium]